MSLDLPPARHRLAPQDDAPATPEASPLVLANADLVLRDRVVRGRVVLGGGLILDVEEGAAVPAGALDLRGDLLLPGLVELHTDNLEWHIEPRPRVDWPHGPAILAHDAELAACGITTVFDALRVGSNVSGSLMHERPYARALATEVLGLRGVGALRIDHRLHLRAEVCSETLVDELAGFHATDEVGLVSIMDHTPGERQFRDLDKLRAYASRRAGFTEAGFLDQVARDRALRARVGDRHVAAAVAAARRLGATLASHDDTDAGHVAASAAQGAAVAEFPTTFEAAHACRDLGIAVMMGAPNLIRGGSHSGNVAAEDLAREGLLDIVSSDYVPSALLLSVARLSAIWAGDLPRAVATVTDAPARATGLTDRGRIAPGLRADLVRVGRAAGHAVARGTWSAGQRVA